MAIDPRSLGLFATIVDEGGLSAAARRLGVSKSSVSRELAGLESRLGLRLLQRTTRRLALTEAGELMLDHARRVADEIADAEAAIETLRAAPCGQLNITAPFAVVRFVLAPRLPAFLAAHPGLALAFVPTIDNLDLIESRIDVAIRIGALPDSSLVARRLIETPLILAAAPEYLAARGMPAEPDDLATHDVVLLGNRADPGRWALECAADGRVHETMVAPRLAINEPSVVLDLVRGGLGIGVLPMIYARAEIEAGRLVRVLPGWRRGARPIHALYPSRQQLTPKVRAFVDFAAACFSGDCADERSTADHEAADDSRRAMSPFIAASDRERMRSVRD